MPIGTFTKKIQRHVTLSTIRPPSTGPSTGAISVGTPRIDMTRPIRCGPAARARMVWPTGMIMPPPRPWRMRKKIKLSADHDSPHMAEPSVNRPSEIIHIRFAPNRSTIQPDSGMTMANASRYPVVTHWIVANDVWKSRLSVSMATLTIVVSRIDIIVPRITTNESRRRTGSFSGLSLIGPAPSVPDPVGPEPVGPVDGELETSLIGGQRNEKLDSCQLYSTLDYMADAIVDRIH